MREAEDSWKCGMIVTSSECSKGCGSGLDLTLSDYISIVAQPFLVSPHDWMALRPVGNYCHLHVNDQSPLPSTIW